MTFKSSVKKRMPSEKGVVGGLEKEETVAEKRCTESVGLGRHFVAGGDTAGHDVEVTSLEDAGFKLADSVRVLLSINDGEVVVSKEATRVALGSDGRSEDDEVLSDRAVQQSHVTHSSSSNVEDPLLVGVNVLGIDLVELVSDAMNFLLHSDVHLGRLGGNLVEHVRVEDEELLTVDVDHREDDGDRQDDGTKEKEAATHFLTTTCCIHSTEAFEAK